VTGIVTRVDLIRHGEPVGGRKYRGQTDDPLSEKGWAQMRAAVGDARPWQAIVSSTLSRCAQFAQELATRHALPLEPDARLIELGFGSWEGRTPDDIRRDDPERLLRFWDDPFTHAPAGAEPLAQFQRRVLDAWREVIARHRGRHVLIVAHAGVVRTIVAHVLAVPLQRVFRIQVPSAGLTRIEVEHHGRHELPKLVFHAGRLPELA
jgi:alpha-ribazole phosphatase/probable phosphoglycerate mutase